MSFTTVCYEVYGWSGGESGSGGDGRGLLTRREKEGMEGNWKSLSQGSPTAPAAVRVSSGGLRL